MEKRNIIVIGASAGGFEALKMLISSLPPNIQASIFIVWHMSAEVKGILPKVLSNVNTIPASNAVEDEPIELNRIYVAPPDHHLLIDNGLVRITRGPKENRFRPAVDPLFRSAAYTYGKRVIGIVLSGALDDGSAGLWAIKQFGGIAVVQDPADAEVASMPESALKAVTVDHRLPVREMPALLTALINEEVKIDDQVESAEKSRLEYELAIAMEKNSENFRHLGEFTQYTCPECHGVLSVIREGQRTRFRCHTGHAFSSDSLLVTIGESIEETLWSAVRNMQEHIFLLNHLGDHYAEINQPKVAATYFRKAKEAEQRAQLVRHAVLGHEQLNHSKISQEAATLDG
jgi:two-component system, chemotaxis family, protein-glutamate methylesterase/glutaminase